MIFVPDSKIMDGRRMIQMSDQAYEVLQARAAGRPEGWLFPSALSPCGYLTDLGKQFRMARRKAQLSEESPRCALDADSLLRSRPWCQRRKRIRSIGDQSWRCPLLAPPATKMVLPAAKTAFSPAN